MSKPKKAPEDVTEQVTEEPVVETPTTTNAVDTPEWPLLYVGPTLHKHGLIQNYIYDSMPAAAENMLNEEPIARALFIQFDDYHKAEMSILHENGYYWEAFKAALKHK